MMHQLQIYLPKHIYMNESKENITRSITRSFVPGVQAYEFQELSCFGRNNLWNAQVLLIEFSILALSINHFVA